MGVTAIVLRAFVITALAAAFVAVVSALGLSLTLDRTQTAIGVAIVAGCVLTYGNLLRISSKRG